VISTKDEETVAILEANRMYIERFCNPETLTVGKDISAPGKSMSAVVTGAELFMPLEGLLNIDEELVRLTKELAKWQGEVKRVQGKLANERFMSKAPEAVVEEERAKETDYLEKYAAVERRMQELKEI
jgi:valyl-tRNA synthetase